MELTKDLKSIVDLGIALTGEKDYERLLGRILRESINITGSDGGILYVKEQSELRFRIVQNKTLGITHGGKNDFIRNTHVNMEEEDDVCVYSAVHKKVVNVADVYENDRFNFQRTFQYDKEKGYRTHSLLVVPLVNHDNEIMGVLKLINALDDTGQVIAYEKKYEYIVYALASQAAVTLDNMSHMEQMKTLLYSMVSAFTTAIDERTPYNANHTKNVAKYTGELIDYINGCYGRGETSLHFNGRQKEQIVMAALLHDIGKLTTPLKIMNKATRLGERLPVVISRMELIECKNKIDFLEEKVFREEYERRSSYLIEAKKLVELADTAPYLDKSTLRAIDDLANHSYTEANGTEIPYITELEKESLSILKGTLTGAERKIMEEHVVITSKLLGKICFSKEYEMVPALAGAHHEFLNGTGYPNHLTEPDIPNEARILTVLDIYDSLISTDRPYKQPIPVPRALDTLDEMAAEGKLDMELVRLLRAMVEERMAED